jgi:hypothetical protein
MLAPFCISAVVPSPVSRADSLPIASRLEERDVGSILGFRPSSLEEFLIGSHSPLLWSSSPVLQVSTPMTRS